MALAVIAHQSMNEELLYSNQTKAHERNTCHSAVPADHSVVMCYILCHFILPSLLISLLRCHSTVFADHSIVIYCIVFTYSHYNHRVNILLLQSLCQHTPVTIIVLTYYWKISIALPHH